MDALRQQVRRISQVVSTMDAMIVVDMQVGLLNGPPKYDLHAVVERINQLAAMVRARSGQVIWIQHCGGVGDAFEPGKPDWELLPELNRGVGDLVVEKTLNDAFAGTALRAELAKVALDRVLVTGWATDFCVDATVRSAVSHNYKVVVVGDGHTVSDRPYLDAPGVIRHHNWVWSHLISRNGIQVVSSSELQQEAMHRA